MCLNVKVFNLNLRINEIRFLVQHESREVKCELNQNLCDSKQRLNQDECRCKGKALNNWCSCKGDYMWNPNHCDCDFNKACKTDYCLDILHF